MPCSLQCLYMRTLHTSNELQKQRSLQGILTDILILATIIFYMHNGLRNFDAKTPRLCMEVHEFTVHAKYNVCKNQNICGDSL